MGKKKKVDCKYHVELTGDTHIHVSQGNDKLGAGIYNISTLPCEGLLTLKNGEVLCNIPGTCDGCCEDCGPDCYAAQYIKFHHNSCVVPYAENTVLAREDIELYFKEIENYLRKSWIGCWRWHVSGEILSYEYLVKMNDLAIKFPYVQFYFYTKRYAWLEKLDNEIGLAKNLIPTVSKGWCKLEKEYPNPNGYHEFILDKDGTAKGFHCPATDKDGHETGVTCSTCRRCPLAQKGMKTYIYKH